MMRRMPVELVITHPPGYELAPDVTRGLKPVYNQEEALEGADFVYVKNWSSYTEYGAILSQDPAWMMTADKLDDAFFMHCLPVRRNVVVEDAVLDGPRSLVIRQAANRTVAAQLALAHLLEPNPGMK
jgi:N-succinyl-L-ornithine transcarbamylase